MPHKQQEGQQQECREWPQQHGDGCAHPEIIPLSHESFSAAMIETAILAKYIPFACATAGGGVRVDGASVITAIFTALITAGVTMYATVSVLSEKAETMNKTIVAVAQDVKELKVAMVEIQIDRAGKIAEGEARFRTLQTEIAQMRGKKWYER